MTAQEDEITVLTIVRYPRAFIFFALLAMALHRLPLSLNRTLTFWKLLGTGRNGGFSKKPDWRQWAILVVVKNNSEILSQNEKKLLKAVYGKLLAAWFDFFRCRTLSFILKPVSAHGSWNGRQPFGRLPHPGDTETAIAVLTRATIRLNRLHRFWAHVDDMNRLVQQSPGLIFSFSIGEMPFIKQATFSLWQNTGAVKNFAYGNSEHATVIKKTRQEKWYQEELFARFKLIRVSGEIPGIASLSQAGNHGPAV